MHIVGIRAEKIVHQSSYRGFVAALAVHEKKMLAVVKRLFCFLNMAVDVIGRVAAFVFFRMASSPLGIVYPHIS
ncbi:MAG: hypothetical protein IJ741_03350 [Schwartzia sp.]|nr:hypothetical protein [Schwartzia sp. (in: firmicutes)]